MSPKISPEIANTAAHCRHYAMCKIDYLGTGSCASGAEKVYVAYYPQGRMDLCHALAEGRVSLTPALVDVARDCDLCGACDLQCHFVTGLRPLAVMKALKERVEELVAAGGRVEAPAEDEPLRRLRAIVGAAWATNDPAVRLTYADDPFPLAGPRTPAYVVLPGSRDEVAAVVRLAGELGLSMAVRGNGGSVFGFVFADGVVLDMNRMKDIEIDAGNWCASVGPGVTSFELQKEAFRRGFRVNAAEPAATVCGNIVCTGTFSTWSNVYGTAADGFVDMEFVDRKGNVFRAGDKSAPNVFAFEHAVVPSPGICTKAVVRLHPVTDDEEGVLVPFADLGGAVRLAGELGRRRIGLAVAVLGRHYIANFLSPSEALAERLKEELPRVLGMEYAVFAVGDAYARDSIRKMAGTVIDAGLLKTLTLGLPRLLDPEWLGLVRGLEGGTPPVELLTRPDLRPLLEAALDPSPETLAGAVDEDLRKAYARLYARPEMTDMVWLNMFRIVSARMSRRKHMFAFLVYVPLDGGNAIDEVISGFSRIAETHGIDHDYGFLTPMDLGKRAILEYDYYLDHTDAEEKAKIGRAMVEIDPWLDRLAATTKGLISLKYVFSQGCSRKEFFLYR